MFRAGGHTTCEGNVLKSLQVRLEEKGKDHATLTLVTKSMAQTSWELANRERALRAFLLKSYLVEPAGKVCMRS